CGFRKEAFYPCYGLAEATLLVAGGNQPELPVEQNYDVESLQFGRAVRTDTRGEISTERRLVSSGRCFAGQRIEIVHPETGDPLPERRIGEIWVSGPSVGRGYWQQSDLVDLSQITFQADLPDGSAPFLRTGDLGFF